MNYTPVELPNKEARCPTCHERLDGATCVTQEGTMPSPGDISICFYCGTLLEYGENYTLHELPTETLEYIKESQPADYLTLMTARAAILQDKQNKN